MLKAARDSSYGLGSSMPLQTLETGEANPLLSSFEHTEVQSTAMLPKSTSFILAALCAGVFICASRLAAHEPLTAEQIARWKTDHSYQDRIARMRRNDPEKISPGLCLLYTSDAADE